MLKNRMRSVRGRGAGCGAPPLAFGSVAVNGRTEFESRIRDLTGGARGVPRPPLPVCDGGPFFRIVLGELLFDADGDGAAPDSGEAPDRAEGARQVPLARAVRPEHDRHGRARAAVLLDHGGDADVEPREDTRVAGEHAGAAA